MNTRHAIRPSLTAIPLFRLSSALCIYLPPSPSLLSRALSLFLLLPLWIPSSRSLSLSLFLPLSLAPSLGPAFHLYICDCLCCLFVRHRCHAGLGLVGRCVGRMVCRSIGFHSQADQTWTGIPVATTQGEQSYIKGNTKYMAVAVQVRLGVCRLWLLLN